uniref:ADAMTS_CR_3 domain-containing protein n=1 Tax=Dracunculus medinensis TaxID=318479 RepID=A0A0N4U8S1_DRAME
LRKCLDLRCIGPDHRERLCNLQPCLAETSTSHEVNNKCSKLDLRTIEVPAEGWTAEVHECVILCRSLKTGMKRELEKVKDGVFCEKEGYNNSVCLSGKCQTVGCDGIIGSKARNDPCGICGGNGSTCSRAVFRWKDTNQFSPCDSTCGPNAYRVSVSVCENNRTGRVVPERLCADQRRPRPTVEKCPHIVCPTQ